MLLLQLVEETVVLLLHLSSVKSAKMYHFKFGIYNFSLNIYILTFFF